MRIPQLEGQSGTLKWMQRLADRHSSELESTLQAMRLLPADARLHWLSPRRDDSWAEYRDDAFVTQIARPDLVEKLALFWPRRGPQWDGLAAGGGKIFLIEGKSHIDELRSTCPAGPPARDHIAHSLKEAKQAMGALDSADWLNGYYQYASRLAHLHFLRQNKVDAWLVFLYFTNDPRMTALSSANIWKLHARGVAKHLGLGGLHVQNVVNVMLDTRMLD